MVSRALNAGCFKTLHVSLWKSLNILVFDEAIVYLKKLLLD